MDASATGHHRPASAGDAARLHRPQSADESLVITGVGAITALGVDFASTWNAVSAGDTGIRTISRFDTQGYPAHVGAEVRLVDLANAVREAATRAGATGDVAGVGGPSWRTGTRCFFVAAAEALDMSGLEGVRRARAACIAGLSVNYVHHDLLRDVWRQTRGHDNLEADVLADVIEVDDRQAARRDGGWQLASVAAALGARGPRALVDTACASSLHALIEAVRWLRLGLSDTVIVGGGCALVNPLSVVAFGRIGALSSSRDPAMAARPFDRQRDGFVLGEGGAAIVIERESNALARGARPLARVRGVAATTNATSMTDPSPGGRGEAAAMRGAFADAGIPATAADLVVAHGTATPKNDVAETEALLAVLGEHARRIPVVSIKGAVGHTLASAGMLNVVTALACMRDALVPPTRGWIEPDPACPLDYGREARQCEVRTALVNAFAFGGQNAAVVLEAVD